MSTSERASAARASRRMIILCMATFGVGIVAIFVRIIASM